MNDVDQPAPPVNVLPVVGAHDGKPVADSRDVARYFNKGHKDVLRAYRTVVSACSQDFAQRNFALCSEYQPHKGRRGGVTIPFVRLTLSGFMLVVGKFTGPEAVPLQEAYVEEFERRGREIEYLRSQLAADDLFRSIDRIRSFGRGALWCALQLERTAFRISSPELPFPGPLFGEPNLAADLGRPRRLTKKKGAKRRRA